jgi:hypothetical protein
VMSYHTPCTTGTLYPVSILHTTIFRTTGTYPHIKARPNNSELNKRGPSFS